MVDVVYGNNFLKSAAKLPPFQQEKLANLIEVLKSQPFSSLLHTKPLAGELAGYFSFRITCEWRVIFQFLNPRTIQLINVAHRKNIYRN